MSLRLSLARRPLARLTGAAVLGALAASPAHAAESEGTAETSESAAEAGPQAAPPPAATTPAPAPAPADAQTPAAPPAFAFAKPVFDETWATIGLGLGMVPSYAGSDDYIAFPLPLIVGRVGGVGISPNGPGFVLDFNPPKPGLAPRKGARIAFGPAFRFRNDRNNRISDAVVARAGKLDAALEVGGNVAVSFPGVFKPFDQLNVGVQARWDVLGAHEGMIVEPQITYRAPMGRAFVLQVQASAEFIDDNFADYYFTVSPTQAAATGLAPFRADGGLNRIGTIALLSYDLDRNPLNGGWSLTGIGGYSRLIGDSADTPYTAVRGDANQFITGLGVAYTF
ncbi:MipA/OmpV family protein [Erythrobacter sp. BLCC-B19]|uniref:MipA/OmpV family protein n=1 Tax=Erythrobacter sp. BLCC-B19 TaxID=3025315 RepID=UPI00235F754A|nr:MipA/OmpV family protein [Erythrobacter sp. BLCC-B19]WDA39696.1 MipA/OmpV family protein [Erythrobacter sp. BLCC-B19]